MQMLRSLRIKWISADCIYNKTVDTLDSDNDTKTKSEGDWLPWRNCYGNCNDSYYLKISSCDHCMDSEDTSSCIQRSPSNWNLSSCLSMYFTSNSDKRRKYVETPESKCNISECHVPINCPDDTAGDIMPIPSFSLSNSTITNCTISESIDTKTTREKIEKLPQTPINDVVGSPIKGGVRRYVMLLVGGVIFLFLAALILCLLRVKGTISIDNEGDDQTIEEVSQGLENTIDMEMHRIDEECAEGGSEIREKIDPIKSL